LGLVYVAPPIYREVSFSNRRQYLCVDRYVGIEFNNGITIDRAMFSRKTVLNYLEYCKMSERIKHYDHGIVGGLWLYDGLMKNYHRIYQEEKKYNHNIEFEEFVVDGHWHFSLEQKKVFAYLADCIISHNMWPADKDTKEMYLKCGLEELVYPDFKKIGFIKNPLLFILAIADTIEPIKLYSSDANLSEVEIWKGIEVLTEKDSITIKILDVRLSFEKLLNKIKDLDNWLDVNVSSCAKTKEVKIEYNGLW